MNYNIRPYKHSDYPAIKSWWKDYNETLPGMFGEGSFILELNGMAALSLNVYLTQSKEIAYIMGYIKNPEFKENLEEYGQLLWNHCFQYAKERGYKRLMCFSVNEKLSEKYKRFGMRVTAEKVTSFVRDL